MENKLITELVTSVNNQLINTIIQFCVILLVFTSIKSFVTNVTDYWKVKASDFGRESHIDIFGLKGYIKKVGFKEVEIQLDNNKGILFVPISNFLKANKIIYLNSHKRKGKKNG